ncbi:MAG: hypothetical protein AB7M12_10925 [Hyphomonadaceae bacterium]
MLAGADLTYSASGYDWLGPGAYFWEADPRRALEWAHERVRRGAYANAAVVGTVIDLGNCLDLTTRENAVLLAEAYASLAAAHATAGLALPENKNVKDSVDVPLRYLDNAVIAHLHKNIEDDASERRARAEAPVIQPFDTVRGMFVEGDRVYPDGGFFAKTHTQIVVRTQRSIKGVFVPRPYPAI